MLHQLRVFELLIRLELIKTVLIRVDLVVLLVELEPHLLPDGVFVSGPELVFVFLDAVLFAQLLF